MTDFTGINTLKQRLCGLSAVQVAKAAGVHAHTVRKVMKGGNVTTDILRKISAGLDKMGVKGVE